MFSKIHSWITLRWICYEMTGKEATAGCDADATVIFAESVYVNIELLSVATVCGALTGALAAALLYVFCLKPLLINRQVRNNTLQQRPLCL